MQHTTSKSRRKSCVHLTQDSKGKMEDSGVLGEAREKLNRMSLHEEKDSREAKNTDSPLINSSIDVTVKFKKLIAEARQMVNDDKLQEALELYETALTLCYSDKLANRISKLKAFIKENVHNESSHDREVQSSTKDVQNSTKEVQSSPVCSNDTRQVLSNSTENRPSITADQDGISEENEKRFRKLLKTSKELTAQGRVREALELNRIALTICHHDKLAKRIEKMEAYLRDSNQENTKGGSDQHTEDQPVRNDSLNQNTTSTDQVEDVQQKFTELISAAKLHTHNGEIEAALQKYKAAQKLCHSEKLGKKIRKIQEYLNQNNTNQPQPEEENNGYNLESEDHMESEQKTNQGDLTAEEQQRFNQLVTVAKQLISDGEVQAALEKNKQALKIYYSEKLQKKITKMEAYLAEYETENQSDEEDNGMVHLGNDFYIFKDLANKLYCHQKTGVLWMWGLHQKKKGGILGDDMGLGKTIQVISFLSGLFDMEKVHSALIVMPVSVIVNWEKEFTKWAPGINIEAYHGSSKREKERALTKVQRKGGVLLTSYGLVVTSWETLSKQNGREFKWDYLILDEGHKIKNPTKTTKAVHQIGAKNRIIMTGTPIQNNLREMWSLFDFVHQGSLLGTARTFKMEYENPITRARERDATAGERRLGMEMAESLKKIIAPFFLRRTKAEVLDTEEGPEKIKTPVAKMPSLTRKNDFIVWLFLTEAQQRIYSDFLSLDSVKELLMTKKSPLVALNVLKKICDHPRLLSTRACAQLGLDGEDRLDDSDLESEEGSQCAVSQIKNMQDEVLINESGKLIVVVELLDKIKQEGHRALLFSQSRKMLDIIQQIITNRGHKVMRLDGTVTHLSDRDQRIQKFQTDHSYSVFLLTTQVGGVGLTLTAADRVIIYDPSWNPATDAQAVDRVFRIGQDKNVVIYRLITCGTVEEKIYRRQVFKDSITRQTTGNTKNPYRYFTKQELKELFTLDNPRHSKTQQQLEEMHSGQRNTDSSLDAHIAFLYSLEIFGLSDHDLMFSSEKCDIDYDDDDDVGGAEVHDSNDYIQHRVQKAQDLLKMESELSQDFNERVSKYPRNTDLAQQPAIKPVSQPFSSWTLEGNVNTSEDNKGNGIKGEVKEENFVDLTLANHGSSDDDEVIDDKEVIDLSASETSLDSQNTQQINPQRTQVKSPDEVAEQVTHNIKIDMESPAKAPWNQSDGPKIKLEPKSPSKASAENYPVKTEPWSPSGRKEDWNRIKSDPESPLGGCKDTYQVKNEPRSPSDVDKKTPYTDDEDRGLTGNEVKRIDIDNRYEDEYAEMSTSGSEEDEKEPQNNVGTENQFEDKCIELNTSGSEDDDDGGDKESKSNVDTENQFEDKYIELSTSGSEEEDVKEPQNNVGTDIHCEDKYTELSTSGNEPQNNSDLELNIPASDENKKQDSSNHGDEVFESHYIQNEHTPTKELSKPQTKTPKSRRKSVSNSPWMKKTPKQGHQAVVEEELLISPDGCRPLISSYRKGSASSMDSPCKSVNLNSTIMSVFSDSPKVQKPSYRSLCSRNGSSSSNLGMTFVEESPGGNNSMDRLYQTVVEDSPNNSVNISRTTSTDIVLDSVQNTPAIRNSALFSKDSQAVVESDDEISPVKLKATKKQICVNSTDESSNEILDSDKDNTPKKSKIRNSVQTSDSERSDNDNLNQVNESDEDSEDSLPCLSSKKFRKKRGAVIVSDDEENDVSHTKNSTNCAIDTSSENEEMEVVDSKSRTPANRKTSKNPRNQVISSSEEESGEDSVDLDEDNEKDSEVGKRRIDAGSYIEGHSQGSEEEVESEEDEGSDMSGFIVDDEEEESEEEDDENSGFDDLPAEMKIQYKQCVQNGRSLYKSREYGDALANFLQALEIFPDPSLQALTLKVHQKMNQM